MVPKQSANKHLRMPDGAAAIAVLNVIVKIILRFIEMAKSIGSVAIKNTNPPCNQAPFFMRLDYRYGSGF
jgi:hypothetical protein